MRSRAGRSIGLVPRHEETSEIGASRAAANGRTDLVLTGDRLKAFLESGVNSGGTAGVTALCTVNKRTVAVTKKFTYSG